MIQLPACKTVTREKKRQLYFVCVLIKNQGKKKGGERKGRFKSGNREAAHGGRQRPAADRQAVSEEDEGGGDVPYVPGGERVDEGEQHLELAAAVGGEARVHLDDHGVDDLAQARRRRGAAFLELPEQRDGAAPARPRRRPARHQRGGDRARGGRAARRHAEPDPPHPPGPRLQARGGDHGIPGRARARSLAPSLSLSPGARAGRIPPRPRTARARAWDAAPCRRRASEWRANGTGRGRDGTERRGAGEGRGG